MATRRPQLSNVLIGANPNAQKLDGWSYRTQRAYDVGSGERFEENAKYAITVHIDRVGAGTVGWVHRFTGGVGELAAVCVFNGRPQPEQEPNGTVFYARCHLWVLPAALRSTGAEIQAAGWSTSPPYGDLANQRFANGVSISERNFAVLRALVDPRIHAWLRQLRLQHGVSP